MPSNQGLLITNTWNVQILKEPNIRPTDRDTSFLTSPRASVLDKQGVLWIADYDSGLIRYKNKTYEQLKQNGPRYSNSFKVLADKQSLIVLGGGYTPAKQSDSETGFYEFKNGWWENYNLNLIKDRKLYPEVRDLVNVARNPVNGKLYFTSFGYGLIEWNGLGDFKIYNSANSPLRTELLNNPNYTRVPGVAIDTEGNVWVTNFTSASGVPGLHVLRTDGSWETFNFQNTSEGTSFNNSNAFEKIVIDDNGYKWMSMARFGSGLVVFDDVNNRFRHYNRGATTGNLPGNDIFALVKDNKGEIWVGTEKGIVVFYNPDQAFLSGVSLKASTPVINRRPLLEDQPVRTIAVDGANRKWVGTDNGVWLFNPDGDEAILNFTTSNSPLPSDKILDIAINHTTGDVFIATEAGLISYRAGATFTTEKPECANVFPNPVRPGFSGQVAISGIANDATVKITDITGTLVYETKALGGTALWNGADYNGERVRPGVYLVLSSNAEGGETCISKVAVIK
jgi:ligand-binding sensor domain-containing protein